MLSPSQQHVECTSVPDKLLIPSCCMYSLVVLFCGCLFFFFDVNKALKCLYRMFLSSNTGLLVLSDTFCHPHKPFHSPQECLPNLFSQSLLDRCLMQPLPAPLLDSSSSSCIVCGLQLWGSLCWEHLQCPDSKLGCCTACQPCNLQCYWCWKACGANQKMLKPAVPCSYLWSLATPHGLAPPQITRAALPPRTAFPLPTIHFFSLLWGVIPWLHSAVWAPPTTPLWQNKKIEASLQ